MNGMMMKVWCLVMGMVAVMGLMIKMYGGGAGGDGWRL